MKKYRHCTNLTACAIEFKKMVGADLHIRPHMDDQLVKMQIFTKVYAPEAYASGGYTQKVTKTQGLNYDTGDANQERVIAVGYRS